MVGHGDGETSCLKQLDTDTINDGEMDTVQVTNRCDVPVRVRRGGGVAMSVLGRERIGAVRGGELCVLLGCRWSTSIS